MLLIICHRTRSPVFLRVRLALESEITISSNSLACDSRTMALFLDEDDSMYSREHIGSRMSAASTPDSMTCPSLGSNVPSAILPQSGRLTRTANAKATTGDVLGQFAFGPAMQTTVVTTTTTTTTQLPPLTVRGPQQRLKLDQKQYPLADTPTPPALRSISFEVEGKRTLFTEADDSTLAMEQVRASRFLWRWPNDIN